MDAIETVITNAQTQTGGVFVLSALLIVGFVVIARRIDNDSPFAPHILPFAGIMIVVPATMFLGITKVIDSNAVSAILASIVAYFFASRSNARASGKDKFDD
ncbi:hypothetical protein FY137_18310 [Agrobacterium tumefaciens]|nr:hypothetical protein FY137_18310 [Agrobacterium tumefaciens]